jgi:hypothetical protein
MDQALTELQQAEAEVSIAQAEAQKAVIEANAVAEVAIANANAARADAQAEMAEEIVESEIEPEEAEIEWLTEERYARTEATLETVSQKMETLLSTEATEQNNWTQVISMMTEVLTLLRPAQSTPPVSTVEVPQMVTPQVVGSVVEESPVAKTEPVAKKRRMI